MSTGGQGPRSVRQGGAPGDAGAVETALICLGYRVLLRVPGDVLRNCCRGGRPIHPPARPSGRLWGLRQLAALSASAES
jgi:hypothetical protein